MDKEDVIRYLMETDDYKENIEEILNCYFRQNPDAFKAWEEWFEEGLKAQAGNKKAKIVEFSIRTRVLVDAFADQDVQELQAFHSARNNILEAPETYLYIENMCELEDDEECPYDPEYDEQ